MLILDGEFHFLRWERRLLHHRRLTSHRVLVIFLASQKEACVSVHLSPPPVFVCRETAVSRVPGVALFYFCQTRELRGLNE